MEVFMGLILLSLIATVVVAFARAAGSVSLQRKFVDLGTLSGRTREEIVAAVGPPSAISTIGPGRVLLQWQIDGYHIALAFNGDVCEGVTHEAVV